MINQTIEHEPTGAEFLMNSWRHMCGLSEIEITQIVIPDLQALRQSEWCPEFEQLMRNRLLMGYFRYEPLNSPSKGDYALIEEAHKRIDRYQKDGNTEHLVDAANMLLLAFMHDKHPKKHFRGTDDGEHCKKKGVAENGV